jgi:transcriptional regulator with XRE-family HTH domain
MMGILVVGGCVTADDSAAPRPKHARMHTLADKVNWLLDHARPAEQRALTNVEVSALIEKVTGEQVSHTTIWKLRNGQSTNPQLRVIEALARTFGVPPSFFFEDYDEQQAGLLQEQVEMLAMIRDADITSTQLRAFVDVPFEAREAFVELVKHTARGEAERAKVHDNATALTQRD